MDVYKRRSPRIAGYTVRHVSIQLAPEVWEQLERQAAVYEVSMAGYLSKVLAIYARTLIAEDGDSFTVAMVESAVRSLFLDGEA